MPHLEIKDIHINDRAREDYGDLSGLAQSIEEKGLIQPISVFDTSIAPKGYSKPYRLLAG